MLFKVCRAFEDLTDGDGSDPFELRRITGLPIADCWDIHDTAVWLRSKEGQESANQLPFIR
jgi:hypothetical protein